MYYCFESESNDKRCMGLYLIQKNSFPQSVLKFCCDMNEIHLRFLYTCLVIPALEGCATWHVVDVVIGTNCVWKWIMTIFIDNLSLGKTFTCCLFTILGRSNNCTRDNIVNVWTEHPTEMPLLYVIHFAMYFLPILAFRSPLAKCESSLLECMVSDICW